MPGSRGRTRRRRSTRPRRRRRSSGSDGGPADAGAQRRGRRAAPYTRRRPPRHASTTRPTPRRYFDAQTAWIVAEHAAGNVAFVLHEGDIVDDDVAAQWMRAYHSLHMLDGVVPYVLSAGNHDYCCGGWPTRPQQHDDQRLLPGGDLRDPPSFKGTFEPDRIENSAHLFDVPGGAGQWLVIALELGPRDTVLAWAERRREAIRGHAGDGGDARVPLRRRHALRLRRARQRRSSWNPHNYPIGVNPATERRRGDLAEAGARQQQHPVRAVRPRAEHRRGPADQHAPGRNGRAPDPGQLPELRARRRRLPAPDAVLPRPAHGPRADVLAVVRFHDRRAQRLHASY